MPFLIPKNVPGAVPGIYLWRLRVRSVVLTYFVHFLAPLFVDKT